MSNTPTPSIGTDPSKSMNLDSEKKIDALADDVKKLTLAVNGLTNRVDKQHHYLVLRITIVVVAFVSLFCAAAAIVNKGDSANIPYAIVGIVLCGTVILLSMAPYTKGEDE